MGKVGSTAVSRALKGLDRGVLGVHVLRPDAIAATEAMYKRLWSDRTQATDLFHSQYLRRRIDRTPGAKRWDVVTLVRDPIARNVSEFFQLESIGFLEGGRARRPFDDATPVAELVDAYLNRYDRHDVPLTWFDDHFRSTLGLDVYAERFPVERGWTILTGDRARTLVLRNEDLARAGPEALGALVGVPSLAIPETNTSTDKGYGGLYAKFLEHARLPADYVERMLDSTYARQFYSEVERDRMAQRWLSTTH